MTSTEGTGPETAIPDLRDIPLDQAPPGLARAVAEYRERLGENGVPLTSFNACLNGGGLTAYRSTGDMPVPVG